MSSERRVIAAAKTLASMRVKAKDQERVLVERIDRMLKKQGRGSASEFAKRLKISRSYLCDLLYLKRTVGDKTLVKIAELRSKSETGAE